MAKNNLRRQFSKAKFFEMVGYEPHQGQQAVHDSTARRRILACGVRWGKTRCAAMEGLAASMRPCDSSIGWVVAPTYDLADRVFSQIVMVVASHMRHRIILLKESERRLVLRNFGGGVSEIRCKSADNSTSLLGEGLDWVIVDEAARLKASIWESHISQRLLDKRGWALLISTPRGKGWFYDLYRRGQRGQDADYESWNSPSSASPFLDQAMIEAERGKIAERAFRQEYEGEFLEGVDQVFRGVRELARGEWKDPVPGMSYFAGLDLAKTEDYTVLVITNWDHEIVFVDRFHRLPWDIQTNRIKASLDRYNHARVLCDTTGVGDPIFESLQRAGCYADPYAFTQKSKADLINGLSILIERGKVTLPRFDLCPELIEELEAYEYSIGDSGSMRMGAAGSGHDDLVIATALALWTVRNGRIIYPPRPPVRRIYDLRNRAVRLGIAFRRGP